MSATTYPDPTAGGAASSKRSLHLSWTPPRIWEKLVHQNQSLPKMLHHISATVDTTSTTHEPVPGVTTSMKDRELTDAITPIILYLK